MKFGQKNPCTECPFRKASVPGWLGPDTGDATGLVNAVCGVAEVAGGFLIGCEPADFACHMDTTKLLEELGDSDLTQVPPEMKDRLQHCVGALLMLKARCKRPHDRVKSAAMDIVSATEPMLNREQFIAHHSKPNPEAQPTKRTRKAKR